MIPANVRIFICTQPVDMGYGVDRLAQVARERVGQDPVEGGVLFVFAGKAATRLEVLWFDRNELLLALQARASLVRWSCQPRGNKPVSRT